MLKGREKQKDLLISNLKGLLILLVVFGHFIEIDRQEYNEIFNLIYLFHMPLFIFISGFLAKRVSIQKVIYLLALYLVSQTLFLWLMWGFGATKDPFDYMRPEFHLWYLVSLAIWYVGAMLVGRIKAIYWKVGVLALIAFGALMSRQYTDNIDDLISVYYPDFSSYTLSYQRTISFAPFFFAGFFLSKRGFEKISNFIKKKSITIALLLTSVMLFFLWSQSSVRLDYILKGAVAGELFMHGGTSIGQYIVQVGLYYIFAVVICFIIINIVTNKASVLTKWGDNSLLIYLLHPVFLIVLKEFDFYQEWSTFTKLLMYGVISVGIAVLLGSQRVTSFMNEYVFTPMQKNLFST